jgi:hypothetical protein
MGAGFAPLAGPVFTGDARAVTPAPGDNDTSIATTAFVQNAITTSVHNDVGRNLVHNAGFRVQQRGAGPWTTAAPTYTADRWQMQFQAGTMSTSIVPITLPNAIGDETARFALAANVAGGGGSSDYAIICQRLPDVRSLGGKTVTVSFWAMADVGSPKIGLNLYQFFGAGGSAGVQGAGQSVTISTIWARYSLTFAVASVAPKIIGTGGDDYTRLTFWLSAGTAIGAVSGSTPVQTATFSFWGVQCEVNPAATPFERIDAARDFRNCQQFYQTAGAFLAGYGLINNTVGLSVYLPVPLRSHTATIALTNNVSTNTSALTTGVFTGEGAISVYGIVVATGAWVINTYMTIAADL